MQTGNRTGETRGADRQCPLCLPIPMHPPLSHPLVTASVSWHTCWFSCQMRNLLGKLCTFQPSLAVVLGDDGTFEFTVGAVELGLVGDDALVESSKPHNVGLEPPVVRSLDCIKEGSIARGWPLKGLVDPMG